MMPTKCSQKKSTSWKPSEQHFLVDTSKREIATHFSIAYARKQGLIQEEALALERSGTSELYWRDEKAGLDVLRDARSRYEEWGAYAKVEHLSSILVQHSK